MAQRITPSAVDLARFLLCLPFVILLALMLIEASLSAATTFLVIKAGRDVANGAFQLSDLMWILAAQSTAYMVGAVSWIFAERAGFLAYGRYMLRFARDNRHNTKLLGDKEARERAEPFLTGETFYVYFHLLYEIEGGLRILLALILNVMVLGTQIDGALPIAYAVVFMVLFLMQWKRSADALNGADGPSDQSAAGPARSGDWRRQRAAQHVHTHPAAWPPGSDVNSVFPMTWLPAGH